jgi:hypothetical protein
MSSPTPGSDPNYPQGGAPQGQPGWGAPQQPPPPYNPAPSHSGPPAGYGVPGDQRPSQVSAAAIIGMVIGGIGTLFGLIGLFAVGIVFAFNAILGLLYLVSIATAVVVLIGGIQAFQGKSPRLLLLGSYVSIGVQLLYLIFSIASGYGFSFSALLGFILPGIIVFLLMQPQAKQYYAARGISY